MLAQRISTISGVAQVQVFGAQKYAVRVAPRSARAGGARHRHRRGHAGDAQRQREPAERRARRRRTRSWTLEATGQLVDAAAFRPLVIAYRDGAPVRLDDVGTRRRQRRERPRRELVRRATARSSSRSSASPAPTPSRWSTRSRRCCPQIRAQIPAAVQLEVLFDRSQSIRASVGDVQVHAGAHRRRWWCW